MTSAAMLAAARPSLVTPGQPLTGLVDELRLSIHPVMVGSGQVLFRDGQKQALKFVGAKTFGTGVVVLTYQPSASRA